MRRFPANTQPSQNGTVDVAAILHPIAPREASLAQTTTLPASLAGESQPGHRSKRRLLLPDSETQLDTLPDPDDTLPDQNGGTVLDQDDQMADGGGEGGKLQASEADGRRVQVGAAAVAVAVAGKVQQRATGTAQASPTISPQPPSAKRLRRDLTVGTSVQRSPQEDATGGGRGKCGGSGSGKGGQARRDERQQEDEEMEVVAAARRRCGQRRCVVVDGEGCRMHAFYGMPDWTARE
jgi:hypothetical protein